MKILRFFLILLFPLALIAHEDHGSPEILVNNRILATVNGKNISVMDVMKKMDVFLAKNYPDEAKSASNRYQFFSTNWKQVLNQIIENELILADAEKMEIKVSDAEIRETLHERFGPSVMKNLEDLGITYDEAWSMIYTEMAVGRMTYYRVHSKAMAQVGPQEIKKAFQEHIVKNPPKEEWKYQVLSIRGATEALGKIYAQKAYALIRNEPLPFKQLAIILKEDKDLDPEAKVTVSDEYNVEAKSLSSAHKAVLTSLKPGTYSEPIAQVSRDKSVVHRIFYLKEHKKASPPKFNSMVDNLHDSLVQDEIHEVLPGYMKKLKKQFNFDQSEVDNVEPNFQPFSLK